MDVINVILIGSSVLGLLAVFLIILVVLYNNRQKMFKQEKQLLEQNHANKIIQTQLEIAEDTAQKISRALHDNIGQKLSAAKLLAGTPGTTANEIKTILGEVINDVRDMSKMLKSEPKINKGLVQGLEYLADLLKKQGIDVQTDFNTEKEPDPVDKLSLYRVCQEAIQNILKHADADKVFISFNMDEHELKLQITDNGKGFNTDLLSDGNGLDNMSSRCETIGAEFNINTGLEKGCSITITKKYEI